MTFTILEVLTAVKVKCAYEKAKRQVICSYKE